jgi:putative hemolysin
MTHAQLLEMAGLGLLILLSAFFSGAETAFLSLDRMRLNFLVQKKRRGARELEEILENPETLLSAVLIGNNVVNIVASVFATALFIEIFGNRGELYAVLAMTPLLLIFAEVVPKTYSARHAERVSFLVLAPIRLCMYLLLPLAWVVGGVSRLINRLTGGDEPRAAISGDEIRSIISVGEQAGTVHKEQHRMLHGVFNLAEMRARDVMIPRTEVVGIEVGATFAEVLALVRASMHSRFPVYEASLDSVVGVIHSKDILNYVDRPSDFSLRTLARPPYFVPESKRIENLLQSFRRRRVHLAVVVDEYGGVEGIVTMEDIVEEIVGEIRDEYDVEEDLFRELAPRRYLVDGSASLRTINRRFGLQLSEEHVTTIAGFVLRTLGSIPEEGASCSAAGVDFVARKVVDNRIEEIELTLPEPRPES